MPFRIPSEDPTVRLTVEGVAARAMGDLLAGDPRQVPHQTGQGQQERHRYQQPATVRREWSVQVGRGLSHTNPDIDSRGKWNRVVVTVAGNSVSLTTNGRPGPKTT